MSGALLGAFLAPSWAHLGALWGHLGAVLAPSWGHVGPKWAQHEPHLGHLEAAEGHRTEKLENPKIIEKHVVFGRFGPPESLLGRLRGSIGTSRNDLGASRTRVVDQ